MTDKICPRCAKDYANCEPWRCACERCGNILAIWRDERGERYNVRGRALSRSTDDGWGPWKGRRTPAGNLSKAVL